MFGVQDGADRIAQPNINAEEATKMPKTDNADRTFTFYLAEVDAEGNTVRKIGDLTSDWETVELVAKRKLRGVRAEFKGNGADTPAAVELDESGVTA